MVRLLRGFLGLSLACMATSCTAMAVSGAGAGGSGTSTSEATSASTGMPSPCEGKATGADCAPKACVDGVELGISRCDAAGKCVPSDMRSCGFYACTRGEPTCMISCNGSSDCGLGAFCQNEACQPGREAGEACSTQEECASRHCVDGVCCDAECAGACQACSAAKKGVDGGADGECGPIAMATDPDEECTTMPASTCKNVGTCDGAGACTLYPAGELCLATTCFDAVSLQAESYCDGTGTCVAGAATVCPNNFACSGASCFTTCGDNTQCAPGYQCTFDPNIGFVCIAV